MFLVWVYNIVSKIITISSVFVSFASNAKQIKIIFEAKVEDLNMELLLKMFLAMNLKKIEFTQVRTFLGKENYLNNVFLSYIVLSKVCFYSYFHFA